MTREQETSKVAFEYGNEEILASPYDAFMAGAQWADQHPVNYDGKAMLYVNNRSHENGYKEAVEKAVVWLRNNWRKYININADGVVCFGHWENDFRKTMKRKQI